MLVYAYRNLAVQLCVVVVGVCFYGNLGLGLLSFLLVRM